MQEIVFILYVSDQLKSATFYEQLLQLEPSLNVPGMTDFKLSDFTKLGLMPENGIAKIIKNALPHPNRGTGIPRCELYLRVNDPKEYIDRAIQLGGKLVDEFLSRDWGDKVGYVADLDGHIIAFAEK